MVSASKRRKVLFTRSAFQRFVSWSMRAKTMGKSPMMRGGPIALYVMGVGSHLFFQMWIFFPLPTLHLVPLRITSRLLWILR